MSLGMFCAIPVRYREWDDACANLMLPCFPLVGAIIGALWWGAAEVLLFSGVHAVLAAAALTVFPFLATGFLHLDGYMDTSDAVLSRRSLEERLRILKDPGVGAFAVVMIAVLFLLQFAAAYAAVDGGKCFAALIAVAVLSRCCAAMALLCAKVIPGSGYANAFRQKTGTAHKIWILFLAVLGFAAACLLAGVAGLIAAVCAALGTIAATAYAYRKLEGVSGDVAGYAIALGELCGLIALAVA